MSVPMLVAARVARRSELRVSGTAKPTTCVATLLLDTQSTEMLSSRLLAASRRAGGMATATAARAASSLAFPHSDLSYRAILRNLRLLAGMRGDKKRFNVLVTGMAADEIARAMRDNEPCLDIQVAGDSRSADWGACRPAVNRA